MHKLKLVSSEIQMEKLQTNSFSKIIYKHFYVCGNHLLYWSQGSKNLKWKTPILGIIPVDFSNLKANVRVQMERTQNPLASFSFTPVWQSKF